MPHTKTITLEDNEMFVQAEDGNFILHVGDMIEVRGDHLWKPKSGSYGLVECTVNNIDNNLARCVLTCPDDEDREYHFHPEEIINVYQKQNTNASINSRITKIENEIVKIKNAQGRGMI